MERKENQSGISQSGWQAACVTLSQVWRSAYANCRHGTFDFEQAQSSSFPLISFSSPASALCMWIVQHRWHSCFERNKIDLLLFSVLPSFLPSFLASLLHSFFLPPLPSYTLNSVRGLLQVFNRQREAKLGNTIADLPGQPCLSPS